MYIIFTPRARRSGVSVFVAILRGMGIEYDVAYGIRALNGGAYVLRAALTGEAYESVESLPNVTAITPTDPTDRQDDPLSGCEEQYEDPHGPLEGCDEPGDPDD